MGPSESFQTALLTLVVSATLYLSCHYTMNALFPHTSLLLELVEKDFSKIKEIHPEVEKINVYNIEGARGDKVARGWSLFITESLGYNSKGDFTADVLLISQAEGRGILQMTISNKEGNLVKEIARTYNFTGE